MTETIPHEMQQCPCCHSHEIKETGEVKEKDELDYKIVVVKRRHKFVEYECEECGKKFHEEIPNNLKEENQYGPEVQALELTLMFLGTLLKCRRSSFLGVYRDTSALIPPAF